MSDESVKLLKEQIRRLRETRTYLFEISCEVEAGEVSDVIKNLEKILSEVEL